MEYGQIGASGRGAFDTGANLGAGRRARWAGVLLVGLLTQAGCQPERSGLAESGPGGQVRDAAREAEPEAEAGVDAGMDAGPDATDPGPRDAAVDSRRQDAAEEAGPDAADADAGPSCESSLPPTTEAPARLSETGLYADIATKKLAASMREFTPQFRLWSDGAVKTRWMYLPECDDVIRTGNMDFWSFPVGTRAFKQFVVDGKRIETRMVHRHGEGPDDFLFAHYLWDDVESEAHLITEATEPDALLHPKGTAYQVPTPDTCPRCHGQSGGDPGGIPSRYLGFSAIQLSHDGPGETMGSLSMGRHLSRPRREGYTVPGHARQRAALGYLHANCGFCHNETADGVSFPVDPFRLWLGTDETNLYDTGAYATALDVHPLGYTGDCTHRIKSGDPGVQDPPAGPVQSCVFERMRIRGNGQMPPLATHVVDEEGLAVMREWIAGLGG